MHCVLDCVYESHNDKKCKSAEQDIPEQTQVEVSFDMFMMPN